MKNLVLILLVVVSGTAGTYYYLQRRAPLSPLEFVRTEQVRRGDLVSVIKATGTIEPEDVVDVGAQVMGRIEDLGVDLAAEMTGGDTKLQAARTAGERGISVGSHGCGARPCALASMARDEPVTGAEEDRPHSGDNRPRIDYNSIVRVGTELAYIDATRYEAQYEQAKAALDRSIADLGQLEAKAEQAAAELRRAQQLRDVQRTRKPLTQVPIVAISESDYDMAVANDKIAKANLAIGKAEVEQRRAACDLAKTDLDYTIIKSPVAGKILERRVNIGQTVVASLNAPSLFLIAKDLTRMQVWASVNEADIGRIRQGMKATFTVDTYPREVFIGQVKQVRLNAQMTQNVVTYTVVIDASNRDERLLPYLTANVKFEVETRKDVLLVSNAGLRWTPEESQIDQSVGAVNAIADDASAGEERGRLWVAVGTGVRPVEVVVHDSDGTWTEVSGDGVQEGLQVVVGDQRPDGAGTTAGEESATKNPFLPQPPKGPRPPPPM
jgi:HlyD family secretion protein